MLENIGEEIKGLARVFFMVETILVIIAGVSILFNPGMLLWGLLVIIGGLFAAWVSYLFVFAFGELVDKTVQNERNTRAIMRAITENDKTKSTPEKLALEKKTNKEVDCVEVKEEKSKGREAKVVLNPAAPYWCDKCGNLGPYDNNCPSCGSSLRRYHIVQ